MHGLLHARRRNVPKVFEGRSSRVYDIVSRRLLRRMYRRFAADIAQLAPPDADVLDIGTGPGVLLVEASMRHSVGGPSPPPCPVTRRVSRPPLPRRS